MRGLRPPQSRRHSGVPKPIRNVLGTVLEATAFTRRSANEEIAAAWSAIVGAEVARHSRVASLRKGILYVEVDSAAWLQELGGFHKTGLLAELQGRVRRSFIKDLQFRQHSPGRVEMKGREQGEV